MPYSFTLGAVIDPAKLGSQDLTNYPLCFRGTYAGAGNDPDLRGAGSGGDVTDINGYDIVFSSDSANTVPLDFEIERYIPATGEVVFWVRMPTVSHSSNTVFFVHYGNAAISTFQGNITGTWVAKWKAVWHLRGAVGTNNITSNGLFDSTVNTRNATDDANVPPSQTVPGIADGALSQSDGTRLTFSDVGLPAAATAWSISLWARHDISFGSGGYLTYRNYNIGNWVRLRQTAGGATLEVGTDGTPGSTLTYAVPGSLQLTTQYYFVATYDGTSLSLWINGVLVAGPTAKSLNITLTGTGYISGQNPAIANQTSDAILDEVRIANAVLGASEILASYNNIFSPSTFYAFGGTPFTASCGNPPDGVAGEFYTHTFPVPTDGGVAPFFGALLTRAHASFTPENVFNNLTLSPLSPTWVLSGYPAAAGVYEFTIDVVDLVSTQAFANCTITIAEGTAGDENPDWLPTPPVGVPDGTHGWDFSGACAHEGSLGLRHRADGTQEVANSKTSSLDPITVVAAQILYAAFWLKGSGSADGTVGFGFVFYDEDDVYLSESYVTSTGSPTSWTQFNGSITVPANAVKAVPTVETIGHLTGTFCIDDVYAIFSGGHFILSSIKHYFDDYTAYR